MSANGVAVEVVPADGEEPTAIDQYTKTLREKILFGLSVYPFLMPSMLHVFLGTSTSADVWKGILKTLIEEGLVCETRTTLVSPHERSQTYTVLHLRENVYTPPQSVQPKVETSEDPSFGHNAQ